MRCCVFRGTGCCLRSVMFLWWPGPRIVGHNTAQHCQSTTRARRPQSSLSLSIHPSISHTLKLSILHWESVLPSALPCVFILLWATSATILGRATRATSSRTRPIQTIEFCLTHHQQQTTGLSVNQLHTQVRQLDQMSNKQQYRLISFRPIPLPPHGAIKTTHFTRSIAPPFPLLTPSTSNWVLEFNPQHTVLACSSIRLSQFTLVDLMICPRLPVGKLHYTC